MRFSGAAYSKLYPRDNTPVEAVESAVESFKPTEDFQNDDFRHLNSEADETGSGEEVIENGDAGNGQPVTE